MHRSSMEPARFFFWISLWPRTKWLIHVHVFFSSVGEAVIRPELLLRHVHPGGELRHRRQHGHQHQLYLHPAEYQCRHVHPGGGSITICILVLAANTCAGYIAICMWWMLACAAATELKDVEFLSICTRPLLSWLLQCCVEICATQLTNYMKISLFLFLSYKTCIKL